MVVAMLHWLLALSVTALHPHSHASNFSESVSVSIDENGVPQVFRYHNDSRRRQLGVGVVAMTPELRRFFGAPADVGILVSKVEDGSPAERARLRVGDVIVEVAGSEVNDVDDVRRSLARHDGDKVKVIIVRKKKRVRKKVVLETNDDGDKDKPTSGKRKALEQELQRTRKQLRSIEKRLGKLERRRTTAR